MLDHVGIEVSDVARSKEFYEAALEPLGIRLLMEFEGAAGFGKDTEHGTDNGAPGPRPTYHPGYPSIGYHMADGAA
jgi:catechol 2,3-dioxygenase-like lactoylglutathione lyase family enzyme